MNPFDEGRLFRELGEIATTQKGFARELRDHIRHDEGNWREVKQHLRDLGANVEETGRHQAISAALDVEKKERSAFRWETVRSATLLLVGGLIPVILNYLANHK